MTKSELITKLMARMQYASDVSEKDIATAVSNVLDLVCDTLEQGKRVEVRGFGSFCLHRWGKRHARNPATGKTWRTEPVHAVHFKPGKELRERVNARFLAEQAVNKASTTAKHIEEDAVETES